MRLDSAARGPPASTRRSPLRVPGGLGVPRQQPCRLSPGRRPARRARLEHLELQHIQEHRLQIPPHSARRIPRSVRCPITRPGTTGEGPACQATTVSTPSLTSASSRRAWVSRLKHRWTSADNTRRTSAADGSPEGGMACGAVISPG